MKKIKVQSFNGRSKKVKKKRLSDQERRKRKLQSIVFFAVIKGWEEPNRYMLLENHQTQLDVC
ncbi:hypothetical protein MKX03_024962 [Papaver bracteatum]|nr:hypothetical protein MKX03_024962 [Papaver bracteatum]